jgi:hypothetical protein
MADETEKVTIIATEQGFPPANIATIYVDGVANVAPSPATVKFYLYRTDPEVMGGPRYKNQVVAQVVMPTANFVHMAFFFQRAVEVFAKRGAISGDVVEAARKLSSEIVDF